MNDPSSPDSQLASQSLLSSGQNLEKSDMKESDRQLAYETITIHSEEIRTTPLHQEMQMSAEYAAFEGYGEDDVQTEIEFYYSIVEEEGCWWTCLVPPWLR
ncbi:hypothetical protein ACQKWADRAFT_325544 [Trichoderma austrokoningii]